MCVEGETTPNRAYLTHHRDALNSLHPSCWANNTDTPMETDGGEVRTVSYRDGRATGHRDREARRDRDRRRGDRRGDRQREERDQERERGATRRQRDRGDRAYRARGPHRR